jgi:predicted  nucleic acid-binding Zn-ribbon protein
MSPGILQTLHRLHRQLADLNGRRERGPKQIRANEANIAHCEQLLARVRDESKAMRMAADQKQLQLKSGEEKIKDLKRKLNGASNNREYQILKEQIAADEMTGSVLEDEILEAFEKIEHFQPKIAEAEAALASSRQKAEQVRKDVEKQTPLIQGDVQRLEAELKQCEEALPPIVRDAYHRMVRQKGEDALAAVEGGFCSGCNTQVPLNLQAEIKMAHPSFCKTCGRLLYLPDGEAVGG